MKRFLLLLTLIVASLGIQGQVLNLDSCFTLARRNNHDLKKAALDISMAQEVKRQVLTYFFPTADLSGFGFTAYQPLISLNITDLAQTEDFKELLVELYEAIHEDNPEVSSEYNFIQHGYSATVGIQQPIFAGGRIVHGNKLAALGIRAAELQSQVTERNILQEIEETYWLVCGLKEKRNTILKVGELLDTIQHVAETALDAGVITRNDILKVKLKKNELASLSLKLENGIALASHLLCQQIGIEPQSDLNLEPFPESENLDITLSDSITVSGRPEYELLQLNVKAEQLRKKLSLGEALPTVGIGLNAGVNNFLERDRWNAIAFLGVKIPLTQWWYTSHKLKEHDIKIQEAELMRDDLQQKMKLQNEQVYDALTEAILLLEQHQSANNMAQDNYRTTLMNYQAGLETMSSLLESQALLFQAMNDYTDARITYRSNLRRYNELNK